MLPPTSFPDGLQPARSNAKDRRVSRTDMDFEQALHAEGTVRLAEGLDVNSLGVDTSPRNDSVSPAPPSKTRTQRHQPPTPVVVPPTPSPGPSQSARMGAISPASSSNDVFYDAEDTDIQTKRRSMYRSPGTSSSPDLATLLRKAKERGGTIGTQYKQEKRPEQPPPPPLPESSFRGADRPPTGNRPRSSTSGTPYQRHPAPSPSMQTIRGSSSRGIKSGDSGEPDDWVLASPRSRKASKEAGDTKSKKSVRAKTSAFLGKMWGQGTIRDKQSTESSNQPVPNTLTTCGTPSFMGAFTPPVPPPRNAPSLSTSPIADVFTSNRGTSDTTKPLPPIQPSISHAASEDSLVLVEQQSPLRIKPTLPVKPDSEEPPKMSNHVKQRSMSVGEIELKKVTAESSLASPLPPNSARPTIHNGENKGWDTTLNGILSDFKGELSQLDPISSSLELRDPSTSARRVVLSRSNTDGLVFPYDLKGDLQTPTLTLRPALPADEERTRKSSSSSIHRNSTSTEGPIISPHTSPWTTIPTRSSSNSSQVIPSRTSSRHGPSPLRSRNGYVQGKHTHSSSRESARLRMQHRSTASSSEPSLIPTGDDIRVRPNMLAASSQQDLATIEIALSKRNDDAGDVEARGKELASRCWAEDEDFLPKEKIAEWLGGQGRINKVTLRYYIDFFNFTGLRLDHAFRRLCAKLYLKAETQQVDRILNEFSRRYWDCNPNTLYGSASLVHAVSYSLLLLNTDLHVADLATKMSRSQFVRNTLSAIQMQLYPNRFGQSSGSELNLDDKSSIRGGGGSDGQETISSRNKRSGSVTSWNSVARDIVLSPSGTVATPPGEYQSQNGSSASVYEPKPQNLSASSIVYGRNWESDMESLLKDMYNAIKSQQILQPQGSTFGARASTSSSLSPGGNMMRNRSTRGPQQSDRLNTLKRGSIRGLSSLIGGQAGPSPYSSNSSIDGRVSPSPSFATSINEGAHASSSSFLSPTLGFASNLSHTIIREAQEDDDRSVRSAESGSTTISITDEELALLGAPWAKEGMLCRKRYWESSGKRAKDKAWMDVFVVIQKGELNMFTFGGHGGSGSGVVGGGNWLDNASSVGSVELAHSLAHALPPPGYNRQRPYCMVLTLSNGGVYFFQAGTEELVNEWVSTCNYWAARTSKEPLAGGVSNMEYGWNRVVDSASHDRSMSTDTTIELDPSDSMSVRSGRSARSKLRWRDGANTMRASHSPHVEKIYINDWKPPLPPTVSSVHDEESQMEALQKHVASMKKDLNRHNGLHQPMAALYQPRSSNAIKAQTNWEKKSQHLLTEIVKYESYIDSLKAAMTLRLRKRGEKALERALVVSGPEDDSTNMMSNWKGADEETIPEADEPPTTPGARPQPNPRLDRNEAGHI